MEDGGRLAERVPGGKTLMDWPTIHHYAEEAELWTSLAINMWVIVGAIGFLALKIYRATLPFTDRLTRALAWSAAAVGLSFFAIAAFFSLEGSGGSIVVTLMHVAAMVATLGAAYVGIDSARERR